MLPIIAVTERGVIIWGSFVGAGLFGMLYLFAYSEVALQIMENLWRVIWVGIRWRLRFCVQDEPPSVSFMPWVLLFIAGLFALVGVWFVMNW